VGGLLFITNARTATLLNVYKQAHVAFCLKWKDSRRKEADGSYSITVRCQ